MRNRIILEIVSCLLVTLFTYAAISKLLDYNIFRFQLERSPFISKYSQGIAWFIPSVELVATLLLIIRQTRLLGFYLSFLLMLLFTGYIYAILHFSYEIPCSCGGVLSLMSWKQHFIFNVTFSIIALTGIMIQAKPSEVKKRVS
jgi:uncharacterized membrane protein YphA (DoxX/SURF4 family)